MNIQELGRAIIEAPDVRAEVVYDPYTKALSDEVILHVLLTGGEAKRIGLHVPEGQHRRHNVR